MAAAAIQLMLLRMVCDRRTRCWRTGWARERNNSSNTTDAAADGVWPQDEVLAHRLGMVPLRIDPALLEYKAAEDVSGAGGRGGRAAEEARGLECCAWSSASAKGARQQGLGVGRCGAGGLLLRSRRLGLHVDGVCTPRVAHKCPMGSTMGSTTCPPRATCPPHPHVHPHQQAPSEKNTVVFKMDVRCTRQGNRLINEKGAEEWSAGVP